MEWRDAMFSNERPTWIEFFRGERTRREFLVTLALLMLYRLLTFVPLPGSLPYDPSQVQSTPNSPDLVSGFINLLSGGAYARLSVLALGLMPYAAASAFLRGLIPLVPALDRMTREDPSTARRKISLWTYGLVAPFALLQSFLLFFNTSLDCSLHFLVQLRLPFSSDPLSVITLLVSLMAGSYFVVWIAELINEYGFRNSGFNSIVFAGVCVLLTEELYRFWRGPQGTDNLLAAMGLSESAQHWLSLAVYVLILVFALYLVIFLMSGRRNIPVMYPSINNLRAARQGLHAPLASFPLRIFPAMESMLEVQGLATLILLGLGRLACTSQPSLQVVGQVAQAATSPQYFLAPLLLYFLFVTVGPWLAEVEFLQTDIAANLRRSGGIIPGVKPGAPTEKYLLKVFRRLIFLPTVFGPLIIFLPWFVGVLLGIPSSILTGEALFFAAGFVFDLAHTAEAEVMLSSYGSKHLV